MADIINQLAGASPELVQLRARRPDALANAQLSFQAQRSPAPLAMRSAMPWRLS